MGRSRRVIAPRFLVVVIGIRRRVLELSRSPPPRTRKGGLFIPVRVEITPDGQDDSS